MDGLKEARVDGNQFLRLPRPHGGTRKLKVWQTGRAQQELWIMLLLPSDMQAEKKTRDIMET
jgi:hypothetical protein